MSKQAPTTVQGLAAQINELILDLWIAIERAGSRREEFALTARQEAVLSLVVSRPEATPRALAEALGVSKGAVSQHLAALERDGYLSRRRDDHDRRVQALRLEPRGRRYRDSLQRLEHEAVERYLAKLSERDIAEIVTALTRLKAAFEE